MAGAQTVEERLISLAASLFGRKGGLKGGRSRSAAKIAAVRENGKKGGRPRKPKAAAAE